MRRYYLSGAAVVALAFGVTAAGAQNLDQRRNSDPGQQTVPAQQRGDQDQKGAQWQDPQKSEATQDPQKTEATQSEQGARNQQGTENRQNAQRQQEQAPPQGGDNQKGADEAQRSAGRIVVGEQDQTRIGNFIRQQRIQPVTSLNFSLGVASTVPPSVRLSKISGELADVFPNYRDFDFFVAKEELVIVDPGSFAIVAFVPISGGETVGSAPPRERTGAAATAEPPAPSNTAEPPAPSRKRATRTEKKSVTVTQEKPRVTESETVRRRPARTETEETVGVSPRGTDELDEPAARDRPIGPPIGPPPRSGPPMRPPLRERVERDPGPPLYQGVPFPLSLFFGR